jgi:hypothetical protein
VGSSEGLRPSYSGRSNLPASRKRENSIFRLSLHVSSAMLWRSTVVGAHLQLRRTSPSQRLSGKDPSVFHLFLKTPAPRPKWSGTGLRLRLFLSSSSLALRRKQHTGYSSPQSPTLPVLPRPQQPISILTFPLLAHPQLAASHHVHHCR